MILKESPPELEEVSVEEWYSWMARNWYQGEHVTIIGPTGSGKTRIAQRLLEVRQYVIVLAVKKTDETLERFVEGPKYGFSKYKIIEKWPPPYDHLRVILWAKPKELEISAEQRQKLAKALNGAYLSGGWTVFYDDAGYITGYLGMGSKLGIMLNQGRSDGLSVVAAMTQPKSMVARLPSETFKQCRHQLIFFFDNEDEIKSIGAIAGINWKKLQNLMGELGEHDFIYKGKRQLVVVRNTL